MNTEKYSELLRDLIWDIDCLQTDYQDNREFVEQLTILKDKLDDIERDMWISNLPAIVTQPKTDKHIVKVFHTGLLIDTFELDNYHMIDKVDKKDYTKTKKRKYRRLTQDDYLDILIDDAKEQQYERK